MSNANMNASRMKKDDEFYTTSDDIDNEMAHYNDVFSGKTVYLNCDDPTKSNFWAYFEFNFDKFNIERLISTHYTANSQSCVWEINRTINGPAYTRTELDGNGDYASPECIALLKQSDIVITNPPFSLFIDYICLLIETGVQFAVLGNYNQITSNRIYPYFCDGSVFFGHTQAASFIKPNGVIQRFGNIAWFTNIDTNRKNEMIDTNRNYDNDTIKYQKFNNYDAINIDAVKDIPMDYTGAMAVPLSFLPKINRNQFDLLNACDISTTKTGKHILTIKDGLLDVLDSVGALSDLLEMDGPTQTRTTYNRVVIRHINPK